MADAFIHICALDGMQAARAGAPILFALGISDPGTWWGELGEIGTAILERIKVNNHTFHKRFVDVAIEVAASSPAASEKAFLAAVIMRVAAVELIAIKGMQRQMVGL